MPSQPIAKKVLKMKRKRAATMPGRLPPRLSCTTIRTAIDRRCWLTMVARITIENDMPAAPKSILIESLETIEIFDEVLTVGAGQIFLW